MKRFMSALHDDRDLPRCEALGPRWQSVAATPLLEPTLRCRERRGASLAAAVKNFGRRRCPVAVLGIVWIALGLAVAPRPATAQLVAPWNAAPPLPFLQGPDLASTLRNGVQMASDLSRFTAQTATDVGRRARSPGYLMQNLAADYQNLLFQFQNLQNTFRAVAGVARQLQSARAANAAAELEAGLNIISEAFGPVQQELQAGKGNRDTVVRMCQVLNEALLEWQKELKKCSSRLGVIR